MAMYGQQEQLYSKLSIPGIKLVAELVEWRSLSLSGVKNCILLLVPELVESKELYSASGP